MKFKEAIAYGASKLQYESLKEGQIITVEGYLSGQDVFVCSPTGSGKSLFFEIAPYAIDWVKARTHGAILRAMAELHRVSTPKFVARNIAAVESRPTSATLRATNFLVYPPSAAFRAIV